MLGADENSQSIFTDPIIWVIAVTSIRASITLLYLRIFQNRTQTRYFRVVCFVVLGSNIVFLAATILADCLICQPIAYRWQRSGHGHCGTQKSFDLFVGVVNLFLDIVIVIMPMPILWRLQMATTKKIHVSSMFALGIGYEHPGTRRSRTK